MTVQQVINHFKLILLEYGWQDTLVSDNGPYYTAEAFTNLMKEYNVNHITSSLHYPQSNGLVEKFVQIVKTLFHKAKEKGEDLFKILMIYCNTPLASNLQSPMQMLQSRTVRTQLPMSNAARRQLHLQPEQFRTKTKNEHLPSHDLCIGQGIIMQDPTNKRWYPAVHTSLRKEPRSYQVTTTDGVTYRKCKPISNLTDHKTNGMKRMLKNTICGHLNPNAKKVNSNDNLAQSRSRRNIKPPVKLNL